MMNEDDNEEFKVHDVTIKQRMMLDVMWSKDTFEELMAWVDTLNEDDKREYHCLHELINLSVTDQRVAEEGISMAESMLNNIGIKTRKKKKK